MTLTVTEMGKSGGRVGGVQVQILTCSSCQCPGDWRRQVDSDVYLSGAQRRGQVLCSPTLGTLRGGHELYQTQLEERVNTEGLMDPVLVCLQGTLAS